MAAVNAQARKKVLRVIAISLLLDLVRRPQTLHPYPCLLKLTDLQLSFTFILPLFPKLLEFYRDHEAPGLAKDGAPTLLQQVIAGLNRYKAAFSRPIDSRYDIVLLGGAMGSLFS